MISTYCNLPKTNRLLTERFSSHVFFASGSEGFLFGKTKGLTHGAPGMKGMRAWWIAALLLAVFTVGAFSTLVKWCWNVYTSRVEYCLPCLSAHEAQKRGTLVCRLSVTPNKFTWNNEEIEFTEAWVEESADLAYFLVWVPYYKRGGWKQVCFKITDRLDARMSQAPRSFPFPRFALIGKEHDFAYWGPPGPYPKGTGVFSWDDAESSDISRLQLIVESSSGELEAGPFTLMRQADY
jgi:hypothetical protein